MVLSPNISLVSQSGATFTVRANSKGRGYANVTVNNTTVGQKFFWVGAPVVSGITYNGTSLKAETYGISASIMGAQWTIGGSMYSSTSEYLYSPYSSGTYTVSVTPYNSCGTGSTYTTQVSFSTSGTYSISILADSRIVNVSPVSTETENTTSLLKSASKSVMQYMLVNLRTGEIGASGSLSVSGGILDFGGVSSGMYVLKLFVENGKEETFKIVLN